MSLAGAEQAAFWWSHAIERSVEQDGYLRRSPFTVGGPGDHKEWLHFVVHAGELDLLVNFSLVDDVRPGAPPGAEFPRLVVLTRTRGGWDGDIERFEPDEVEVVGGAVDMRYGANHVRFAEGAFQLRVALRRRPIELSLRLVPQVLPAHFNNIRLVMEDRPIHWIVLPRLAAHGSARVGDERFELQGAPAYHDHDWGHFQWGRDFAWEWGFSVPRDAGSPWTVVFTRMCDRARNRTFTQGLFLWKRESHHRIFRGREIDVAPRGFLRARSVFKLPAVMSLLAPGTDTDVPRSLEVLGEGQGDRLRLFFDCEDVAQVCIPNDSDDEGVTIINEVSGRLGLEGEVRGERVEMESWGMFEFVRGA